MNAPWDENEPGKEQLYMLIWRVKWSRNLGGGGHGRYMGREREEECGDDDRGRYYS